MSRKRKRLAYTRAVALTLGGDKTYSQRMRLLLAALLILVPAFAHGEPIRLTRITHIYGITPDPADPAKVLIATDRGFFVAGPDGNAEQLSTEGTAFQAFAPVPNGTFLVTGAAGQSPRVSRDFGKAWDPVSPTGTFPGPFLVLEASPVDPLTVWGATGTTIYRSMDAGRTWAEVGPAPAPVVDLAATDINRDTAFLGTARGLFRTGDGGKTWTQVAVEGATRASPLVATIDGNTYAFVTSIGLVQLSPDGKAWSVVAPASAFDGALLHLTARSSGRAYAVTQYMKILVSDDLGRTWSPFNPP